MADLNFPSLDAAIAQFEGNYPGSLATRANNPGNIQAGLFASSQGAIGQLKNDAVFPTFDSGLKAMDTLISQYANHGYTLDELIKHWAPATAPGNTPASTQNYVNSVASKLGADPGTPLSTFENFMGYFRDKAGVPNVGLPGDTTSSSTFSWSRIAAFVLGIFFITIAGLLFGISGIEWGAGKVLGGESRVKAVTRAAEVAGAL